MYIQKDGKLHNQCTFEGLVQSSPKPHCAVSVDEHLVGIEYAMCEKGKNWSCFN